MEEDIACSTLVYVSMSSGRICFGKATGLGNNVSTISMVSSDAEGTNLISRARFSFSGEWMEERRVNAGVWKCSGRREYTLSNNSMFCSSWKSPVALSIIAFFQEEKA